MEEGGLFSSDGGAGDYLNRIRELEKEMLKIDLSRGGVMPLTIDEFVEIFDEPLGEDLHDITQSYIKLYLKQGNDLYIPFIVDAYSTEWIEKLLKYNESIEEYELCAILKEHLDIYEKEISE